MRKIAKVAKFQKAINRGGIFQKTRAGERGGGRKFTVRESAKRRRRYRWVREKSEKAGAGRGGGVGGVKTEIKPVEFPKI